MENAPDHILIPIEHIHAMDHYFTAIHRPDRSYTDMIIATDDLTKQYYDLPDQAVVRMRDIGGFIPDSDFYEADPAQAMEQFLLFPLRQLGTFVDDTYALRAAETWYDRTVETVLDFAAAHSAACMNVSHRALPLACSKSIQCPRKVVDDMLLEPALHPQFDQLGYELDSDHQLELVNMKLRIAKKYDLEAPQVVMSCFEQYRKLAVAALGK